MCFCYYGTFFLWVLLTNLLEQDKVWFEMNHHITCLTVFLSPYLSARIFLSYQSRQAALESKLESNLESIDSCHCPPSDRSFSRALDPHCPYIRRKEVIQFLM